MQYIVNLPIIQNDCFCQMNYFFFFLVNGACHLICNIVQFYGFNIFFKINITC